jgi:hypothetical protein
VLVQEQTPRKWASTVSQHRPVDYRSFIAIIAQYSHQFRFISVLIDDRQDLQQDWEAAGGIFILHTDTVSSLRQLREKGIIKPQSDTKVETPKDEEPDTVTTTTTGEDDETSKVSGKETQGMQLDAKVETPKD